MLHLEGERSEIRCYKHRLHVYGRIHPPAGHLIFALPLRFWKISKQNCLQRRKRLLHWLIWFIGLFLCVHIHWILWLCPVYYFFVYFTMDTFTGQWACLRFIGLLFYFSVYTFTGGFLLLLELLVILIWLDCWLQKRPSLWNVDPLFVCFISLILAFSETLQQNHT